MITDEARNATQTLAEALQTHSCDEPPMKGGRNRSKKLPGDISDRLQVLTMPVSMAERMRGRIPVRRRQKLASRRLARKERAPKGTKRMEPLAGGKDTDAGNTGDSVPKDRKHGVSESHTMVGDDGGGGERSHQRAVPGRGFPK